MTLTDSEVGSIKAALNFWEWFEYISTAIVFFGCVGEFLAEFTSLAKGHESKQQLARLSLIVLIIGIAGELLGTVRTSQLSGQLIANIELRAGNAEQKAGDANKEAAQLGKETEGLKSENLKLEAQLAPRRLTANQQGKIAENCSRFKGLFKGKRAKLVSYSLDTESFVLAEQVVTALRMKPCEMFIDDDAMSITPAMSKVVFGIQVFGPDSALAKNIADAIGSSGTPVAVSFVGGDPTAASMRFETANSVLPHDATVLVGLKLPDPDTIRELNRITPATKPNP